MMMVVVVKEGVLVGWEGGSRRRRGQGLTCYSMRGLQVWGEPHVGTAKRSRPGERETKGGNTSQDRRVEEDSKNKRQAGLHLNVG